MIGTLKREMLDGKSEFNDICNQTQLLKKFCVQLQDKISHSPLNKLQPELEKVFDTLFDKINGLRESNEGINNDIATLQVTVEEERSRSLMCEEEISKLEHQISTSSVERNNETFKFKQELQEMASRVEDAMEMKNDANDRYERLQANFENTTKQNKTLQLANQKLHTNIRDQASSRSEAVSSTGEQYEKIEQLKSLQQESEREKTELLKSMNVLKEEIISLKNSLNPVQQENDLLKGELKKKDEEMEAKINLQSQSITKLQNTAQQYQLQLKTAQDILQVVQESNRELQETNTDLKNEIVQLNGDVDEDEDEEKPVK